jgi:hypothetical protein
MPFPSTLTAFTYPLPTNRLNSPSHSSVHGQIASALGQVETIIGRSGDNSVLGTIIGDLRSPDSGGGGHVQTANKGGTGQTSYTKGDILVSTSSSVLAKLAIGGDNSFLRANSSTAAGLEWASGVSPKLAISTSVVTITSVATEQSILSVTIPGSTIGTSNAVRGRVFVNWLNTQGAENTLLFRGNYGTTSIGTLLIGSITGGFGAASIVGTLDITVMGRGATSSQQGILNVNLYRNTGYTYAGATSFIGMINQAIAPVDGTDSGGNQTLGITAHWQQAVQNKRIETAGYIIEQIR